MKEAEYIQFLWFSNEFVNQDIEQFYQDLVGTNAETIQRPVNASLAQPFLCQAIGNYDGLNHLVRYDSQRLDWVVGKSNEIKFVDSYSESIELKSTFYGREYHGYFQK